MNCRTVLRVCRIVGMVTLLALVPLIGAPSRLLHPSPWIVWVLASLILILEPTLTSQELVFGKGADRRSAQAIFTALGLAMVVAVIDFGYREVLRPKANDSLLLTGCLIAVGGLAFRLWSIHTLGKYFTSAVGIREGHRVIENGPYRLIRHPSYTGALVMWAGAALILGSWIGLALVLGLGIPAYLYRIRVEENVMCHEFGATYENYMKRTRRLIPFVY
jgi:protein-S-isoprenylcysteine O-methyltransferase